MPVHLDTHTPALDIDPDTTKGHILAFLYQNPEYGYKPTEIQTELDIPHGTATTTLARLEAEDYIGKTTDSYYHALADRSDLRRFAASYRQLTRLTDEFSDAPSLRASQTTSRDDSPDLPTEETIEAELSRLAEDVVDDESTE